MSKLSDGAFSIVSHFSDGAGSARRESAGDGGIGDADKIRDGPRAILTIFTDFAELARPPSGNNRESRKVGDGSSSVLALFTLCAKYGRPQFGRNRDGRSMTGTPEFAIFLFLAEPQGTEYGGKP